MEHQSAVDLETGKVSTNVQQSGNLQIKDNGEPPSSASQRGQTKRTLLKEFSKNMISIKGKIILGLAGVLYSRTMGQYPLPSTTGFFLIVTSIIPDYWFVGESQEGEIDRMDIFWFVLSFIMMMMDVFIFLEYSGQAYIPFGTLLLLVILLAIIIYYFPQGFLTRIASVGINHETYESICKFAFKVAQEVTTNSCVWLTGLKLAPVVAVNFLPGTLVVRCSEAAMAFGCCVMFLTSFRPPSDSPSNIITAATSRDGSFLRVVCKKVVYFSVGLQILPQITAGFKVVGKFAFLPLIVAAVFHLMLGIIFKKFCHDAETTSSDADREYDYLFMVFAFYNAILMFIYCISSAKSESFSVYCWISTFLTLSASISILSTMVLDTNYEPLPSTQISWVQKAFNVFRCFSRLIAVSPLIWVLLIILYTSSFTAE